MVRGSRSNRSKSGNSTTTIQTISQTSFEAYKGPVPSPKQLADFEEILPGSAARFMAMAEKEQAARIVLMEKKLDADIDLDERELTDRIGVVKRGQRLSLVVAISSIIGAVACAALGCESAAAAIAAAGLAPYALAVIWGRSQRSEQSTETKPDQ